MFKPTRIGKPSEVGFKCLRKRCFDVLKLTIVTWLDLIALATAFLVVGQAGTGGNQSTYNNVLLQTAQVVGLPVTAASVSTRVVSWKEAAEMKDSVARDALVIPSRIRDRTWPGSCLRPAASHFLFQNVSTPPAHPDQVGVTGIGDFNLTQHLTHDGLDVLVVDLYTLQTVYVLDFVDDVTASSDALQTQDVVRVGRTIGDNLTLLTCFHLRTRSGDATS